MFDGVKVRFSLVFYIVVVKQGGTERHTGSLVHNRLCVYQAYSSFTNHGTNCLWLSSVPATNKLFTVLEYDI